MRRLLLALWLCATPIAAQTVLSVEHITMTLTNGSATVSATPTLGQDLAMTVPFVTVREGSTDPSTQGGGPVSDFEDWQCNYSFSGGNLVMTRSTSGGNGDVIAEVYLVEFDPTHWEVQSAQTSISTAGVDVTLGSTLSDYTRAFYVGYARQTANADTYYNNSHLGVLTSNTNLNLYRPTNTPTLEVNWWVVEDISSTPQISVHYVDGSFSNNDYIQSATTTAVNMDRTWLLGSTARTSSFWPWRSGEGVATATLAHPTRVRFRRGGTGEQTYARVQVIEFVGNWGWVQRGQMEMSGASSPYDALVSDIVGTPSSLAMPVGPTSLGSLGTAATWCNGCWGGQSLGLVSFDLSGNLINARRDFDSTTVPPSGNLISYADWQVVDWGALSVDYDVPGVTDLKFGWRESWTSPLSIAFDAGWEQTGEALRGYLDNRITGLVGHFASNFTSTQLHGASLPVSSADQELHQQFISPPLAADIEFESGVTLVNLRTMWQEGAWTNDMTQCITGIRVIDEDGVTVNATLLSVANYGTLTLPTGNVYSKVCAHLDTVTADYTTVAGDRLVVELGMQTDGATPDVPVGWFWGMDNGGVTWNANDQDWGMEPCGKNESSNPTYVTMCYGHITFSVDLVFLEDTSPGPTRMYLPATEAAAVTPAITAANFPLHPSPPLDHVDYAHWRFFDEFDRRRMTKVKGSSTLAENDQLDFDSGSEIDRQYVSDPMVAGITFEAMKTRISAQIKAREGNVNDDIAIMGGVRIFSEDGTTLRATILPVDFYFGWQTMGGTPGQGAGAELGTTFALNETVFRDALSETTYTTVAGDRLVFEIGMYERSVSSTPAGFMTYGESEPDCDQTDSYSVTPCAPWIEFSNSIVFTTDPPPPVTWKPLPPWFGRFL